MVGVIQLENQRLTERLVKDALLTSAGNQRQGARDGLRGLGKGNRGGGVDGGRDGDGAEILPSVTLFETCPNAFDTVEVVASVAEPCVTFHVTVVPKQAVPHLSATLPLKTIEVPGVPFWLFPLVRVRV